MKKSKERYPYTYACDLIRNIPDLTPNGLKLSRSEASKIRSTIAKIIGIDDSEMATKLADYYLHTRNNTDIVNKEVQQLIEEVLQL